LRDGRDRGALRSYRPGAARRDLTAAALAVPPAMAYAELAGATPVAGVDAAGHELTATDWFHDLTSTAGADDKIREALKDLTAVDRAQREAAGP
jgi:hypothetical protein